MMLIKNLMLLCDSLHGNNIHRKYLHKQVNLEDSCMEYTSRSEIIYAVTDMDIASFEIIKKLSVFKLIFNFSLPFLFLVNLLTLFAL